ncbi:MAG TPA: hypothetical protein VGK50_01445 [Coriobacteriia bacterium]
MDDLDNIRLFLLLMKQGAAAYGLVLLERTENLAAITALGISLQEAKERVLGLTPMDAMGPVRDGEKPNERKCEFGADVCGSEVYVKVIVELRPDGTCQSVAWSFHFPNRPIAYPYRQNRERQEKP